MSRNLPQSQGRYSLRSNYPSLSIASMTSVIPSNPQRCTATRRDGALCTAQAGASGFCIGHSPTAQEARRKGGYGKSRAERARKLLPARLRPIAAILEDALSEVHRGDLNPRQAHAMASLAGALVRVISSGELEERMRVLESRLVSGNNGSR